MMTRGGRAGDGGDGRRSAITANRPDKGEVSFHDAVYTAEGALIEERQGVERVKCDEEMEIRCDAIDQTIEGGGEDALRPGITCRGLGGQ